MATLLPRAYVARNIADDYVLIDIDEAIKGIADRIMKSAHAGLYDCSYSLRCMEEDSLEIQKRLKNYGYSVNTFGSDNKYTFGISWKEEKEE